jgi:hypothetical protein
MLDTRLAAPQDSASLTMVPVVAGNAAESRWILLSDAVATGVLRIMEIGSGTVPRLLAKNAAALPVLVLDGEQLIGARQNRTTNRSILLAAGTETEIPVSCMEQGRWHFASDTFHPAPQHSPARVRRKAREIEAFAVSHGYAPADRDLSEAQEAVWDEIAALSKHLGVSSPTGALDDTYAQRGADIDAQAARFPLVPGQIGIIGLVREEPVGLDIVGNPSLYARVHARLIRGYILDALDTAGLASRPTVDTGGEEPGAADRTGADRRHHATTAKTFFDTVMHAPRTVAPSVGIGQYSVLSGRVIGGDLTDDTEDARHVAHLSAFPAVSRDLADAARRFDAPIAPPSRRRRR